MNYLIIGNGIAGISAAEAIRRQDVHGTITMVAAENSLPYCRPMISSVLEGTISEDQLPIRSSNFYDELRIRPVLDERVVAIDLDTRTVSTAAGLIIPFDRLLIATGADPRSVAVPGSGLQHIFPLRSLTHVQKMLTIVPQVHRAVVLGGGLVGFKAAYALLRRGLHVSMVIGSAYPLAMQVDETAGHMILHELQNHGLRILVGSQVHAFAGHAKVNAVALADGTELPCELVVVGKGVAPACKFISADRIAVNQGIVVNEHLETSFPGIYAAGDVAELVDLARRCRFLNAIWPEAVDQGIAAGMNMAGRPVCYRGSVSRNVIRIFSLDVMTAGLVAPPADDKRYTIISSLMPRRRQYRKMVFCDDRLVGMILINDIAQGGVLFSLIRRGLPLTIPKEKLLDSTFQVRSLLW
ncbi:MAG: NAD(P)/FAD-dependent oxidoreductase [Deltaproteobacteria bacterium]|nr:NAD(P)/FAD-dependent oxidoreductase [Candidatus Anaeroferrophillus wilburensis]MBN2888308.1 NAD(P)/FAD-dependent oxidoreductase [Deltaproteobacteria bacterium]